MRYSKAFSKSLKVAAETSVNAHSFLMHLISSSPVIDEVLKNTREHSLTVDVFGDLNGKSGMWHYGVKFNEAHEIAEMAISFTEESSSKKQYCNRYSAVVKPYIQNKVFDNTIIDTKIDRVHNYRFKDLGREITSRDIAKIKKPETISRETISTSKNNEIIVVSFMNNGNNVVEKRITTELKNSSKDEESCGSEVFA